MTPFTQVPWLGHYFFLYPGVMQLEESTGLKLHAAERTFFAGPSLEFLAAFVGEWEERARAQPEVWQQRCGKRGGEVWYEPASRGEVLAFLSGISRAIAVAAANGAGVFISGC
jgi:hypothetical protein